MLLIIARLCFCPAGRDHPVFCALVNGEGEVTDFLRLPHFTKRRTAWREEEREKKASGWDRLPGVHLEHILYFSGDKRLQSKQHPMQDPDYLCSGACALQSWDESYFHRQ